jgi:uncharacterized membrane protein
MKWIILLLLVPLVLGAELRGNVYDYNLEPLNDVVISIDSVPKQQYISKDGEYEFDLAPGLYHLKASYNEGNATTYSLEEEISVQSEGRFVYDLILFPELDEEIGLSDEPDIELNEIMDEEKSPWIYALYACIGLLFIAAALYFIFHKIKKLPSEDEVKDQVYAMVAVQRRITQKDIRKELPFSEAKISLVIAELEHEGKIKKIKKGRGNIIAIKD